MFKVSLYYLKHSSHFLNKTTLKQNLMSKNAQILASDFGKPQNWETFPNLTNFEISGVFVNKFDLKLS